MKTTTRKNQPDPKCAQLEVLRESLNVSTAAFDSLLADSFEKHNAKRSLAGLEEPYTTLLHLGETYGKKRETCPRWDEASKYQDQPRSDAYRKPVAKHSIHGLVQGYLTLLKPVEPCEANQKKFPRWSSGRHTREDGRSSAVPKFFRARSCLWQGAAVVSDCELRKPNFLPL